MTYEFQFVYVCTISVPVLFFFWRKTSSPFSKEEATIATLNRLGY